MGRTFAKKCILPSNFKDEGLNDEGECRYCQEMTFTGKKREVDAVEKGHLAKQLDYILKSARRKGKFYDVAVGFSGGKDSVFLCHKLQQEYDLKVLAITIDHGYFPPTVKKNIAEVAQKLELDVLYHRIDQHFMDKFFKHQFETYQASANSVFDVMCGPCSEILEGNVMRIAAQLEIPVVLIGLSPEQTNRYFFEMPREHVEEKYWNPIFDAAYFNDGDRGNLWNPNSSPLCPEVYFPFHVWDYNVEEIVSELSHRGLLSTEASDPLKTECKIMQVMRYLDGNRLGYDPRIGPFSDLVRFGKASRQEMIEKFYGRSLNPISIRETSQRLGVDLAGLVAA